MLDHVIAHQFYSDSVPAKLLFSLHFSLVLFTFHSTRYK